MNKLDKEEDQMFYAYVELLREGIPKDFAYWGVYGTYAPTFEEWIAENRNFMGDFKPVGFVK